jgi:hypothetical protein
MDWKRMANRAKQVIDKRGGPQSVKEDAEELLDIAKNRDSTSDKFKEAAEAIKEPGAGRHESGGGSPKPGAEPRETPSPPQNTPDNPPQKPPTYPPQTGSSG